MHAVRLIEDLRRFFTYKKADSSTGRFLPGYLNKNPDIAHSTLKRICDGNHEGHTPVQKKARATRKRDPEPEHLIVCVANNAELESILHRQQELQREMSARGAVSFYQWTYYNISLHVMILTAKVKRFQTEIKFFRLFFKQGVSFLRFLGLRKRLHELFPIYAVGLLESRLDENNRMQ